MAMQNNDRSGQRIALYVRDTRRSLGLSQAALAARAGCSLPSVGTLEAGVIPKRSRVLARVLTVLIEAEAESATQEGA